MINSYTQPFGFTVETTQDGSPTLRLPESGESMHHFAGAAGETIYIYGNVIDKVHDKLGLTCKTCILGLGLGYIEIAWAISLLKKNFLPSKDLTFHSFEIVEELRQSFLFWIHSDKSSVIYDVIVEKMNPLFSSLQVKQILRQALQNGSTIESDIFELNDFKSDDQRWNIICYDAYSRKTNEGLWSAEFLDSFFKKFAARDCVLTTYACTTVLRNALVQNNFVFTKRLGFSGKRDSSLAYRGCLA